MDSSMFWYISRTAALAAYMMFFLNIVFGLGMKLKFMDKFFTRWRIADLHQFTALLGVALVCLHIFSLLGDTYITFNISQLFVPSSSTYRAVWTAWGIVGFYGMLMITFSGYLRKHIGQYIWRLIHMASFGLFWVVLFHGIEAGTDTVLPWVRFMYVGTGSIVACLFLLRLQAAFSHSGREAVHQEAGVQQE